MTQQTPKAYASYRECTNAASGCAEVCGINQFADVTANANGTYTCGCAGSCSGTAGQSCGSGASATCTTTQTSSTCGKGGVCGALWCCGKSAVGSTPVYKTGTTGGSSSSSSSNSSSNGTAANATAAICSSVPGSSVGTWTCDGSNLHLCKGSTDAQILSCNGKGCHQYGTGQAQDDTCNDSANVAATVPYSDNANGTNNPTMTCSCTDSQNFACKTTSAKNADITLTCGSGTLCTGPYSFVYTGSPNITFLKQQLCKQTKISSLEVLAAQTQANKPVDTNLTAQMNVYAAQTGANLLAQAKNTNGSHVLAATTYTASDKLNYDTNTNTAAKYKNDNFNMSAIPTGKYKVYMHIDRYLNTKVIDEGGNDSFTFPLNPNLVTKILTPIPGDAAPLPHGDNYIDIQDYNYVLECQGLKTTQKSATCPDAAMADMDENGIINDNDLALVRSHFGESGDSPFPPQFTCVTDPSCVSGNSTIQACALKCSITTPNQ
ncbi:MAG TPA: hypothetical protein VLG12_08735 [Candidatus Saccharimonadales bacterium]|nr:hypothetical protein [Candidatus Saccharimonadales bacterium]